MYKNPLRIEIFDNNIESIRLFDVESQSSNSEIKKFSLSKGDLIPLNIDSVNLFKSKWRDYFQDSDERYCELFQLINNNKMPEGIEVYLPFFFNGTSDLIASIFGDAGMHTRAAVSTNSLPLGVSVEVDAIFELK